MIIAGLAFWHFVHEAHSSFTSLAMPGQSILSRIACRVRSLPKCPAIRVLCAILSTCVREMAGTITKAFPWVWYGFLISRLSAQ